MMLSNPLFSNSWGETLSVQKSALRWDIKRTMKNLCGKLLELGEQCFVVTVNPNNGFVGHMGTQRGDEFIEENTQILYDFLRYCEEELADSEPCMESSGSETETDEEVQNYNTGTQSDSLKDILKEPDRDQLPWKLYISAISGHVDPKLHQSLLGKTISQDRKGSSSVETVGGKPSYIPMGKVDDIVKEEAENVATKASGTMGNIDSIIDNIIKEEELSCKSTQTSVVSGTNKYDSHLKVNLFSKKTKKCQKMPSIQIKTEADDKEMLENESRRYRQHFGRPSLMSSEPSAKRKRKFDDKGNNEDDDEDEGGDENEEEEEEQSDMDDKDLDYKPERVIETTAIPLRDAPIQTRSRKK